MYIFWAFRIIKKLIYGRYKITKKLICDIRIFILKTIIDNQMCDYKKKLPNYNGSGWSDYLKFC